MDEDLYAVYVVIVESTEEAFLNLTENGLAGWDEVARDLNYEQANNLVKEAALLKPRD